MEKTEFVTYDKNRVIIKLKDKTAFRADLTFDCGQCFRFERSDSDGAWRGIAYAHPISVLQDDRSLTLTLTLEDGDAADGRWLSYLGLDRDYSERKSAILSSLRSSGAGTDRMEAAMTGGDGIRIMAQEPFETLVSFIISQNNNIPRIKKIISRLCASFGREVFYENGALAGYAFPTPEALAAAGCSRIRECGTGFRDKYIFDAACAVLSGKIDLEALKSVSCEEAQRALMQIKGVGPKVAACVSLFSLGHEDAFPIDVWVKRVLSEYYPEFSDDFSPRRVFGQYAGLAQQYLFFYERLTSSSSST